MGPTILALNAVIRDDLVGQVSARSTWIVLKDNVCEDLLDTEEIVTYADDPTRHPLIHITTTNIK